MTPDQFTTAAIAWATAIGTVVVAATPVVLLLLAKIKAVQDAAKAMHDANAARLDQHDAIQGVTTVPPTIPLTVP